MYERESERRKKRRKKIEGRTKKEEIGKVNERKNVKEKKR